MGELPLYISITFSLTALLTVGVFYKAAKFSKATAMLLLIWLLLQTIVSVSGFYRVTNSVPPRFAFLVLPPIVIIIGLFATSSGRQYLGRLDCKTLTILHTIRIPVELVLFWLFLNKVVPQSMTFEGRNFDILSGFTAPIIYYFGYVKKQIGRKAMVIWNVICLGLLVNIVVNAVLSAPFPFQKFAFNQPDIAILYFPFVWLPCCIVPIVLLAHLATIRQLIKGTVN